MKHCPFFLQTLVWDRMHIARLGRLGCGVADADLPSDPVAFSYAFHT